MAALVDEDLDEIIDRLVLVHNPRHVKTDVRARSATAGDRRAHGRYVGDGGKVRVNAPTDCDVILKLATEEEDVDVEEDFGEDIGTPVVLFAEVAEAGEGGELLLAEGALGVIERLHEADCDSPVAGGLHC